MFLQIAMGIVLGGTILWLLFALPGIVWLRIIQLVGGILAVLAILYLVFGGT